MRLRILGHPVHPILTDFPIGLWLLSFVWDVVAISTGSPMWWTISFWTMLVGLLMALPTAVTGLVDFTGIRPEDPAKRTAIVHMVLVVSVASVFLVNLILRGGSEPPPNAGLAIFLTGLADLMLIVGGWFGGKLVFVHGIGTEQKAEEEAPTRISREEPIETGRR